VTTPSTKLVTEERGSRLSWTAGELPIVAEAGAESAGFATESASARFIVGGLRDRCSNAAHSSVGALRSVGHDG
jgi:hypothetical protein